MTKLLLLSEFIKYTSFEDIMFEGIYDDPWGRETAKFDARNNKTGSSYTEALPLLPDTPAAQSTINHPTYDSNQPIQLRQPQSSFTSAQPAIKDSLVDFIANQLPNVRLDPNKLTLGEIVAKNDNNLGTTLTDPKMVDLFRMLGMGVRGWLSQLKGESQQQANEMLKPFGGNITQLVKAIAPDVSAKLKQSALNGTK